MDVRRDRERRLAEALRANLRRRKAQARVRIVEARAADAGAAGAQPQEARDPGGMGYPDTETR